MNDGLSPSQVRAVAAAQVKTDHEITVIAKTAAKEAVNELLLALGVDASQPQSVLEMQRDFSYLRSWRQSIQLVRTRGLATAVAVIVTGSLGLLFMFLKGHTP